MPNEISIGGVNAYIGLDTQPFDIAVEGLVTKAKNLSADIMKSLGSISLESIVKGDRLKSLDKFQKETRRSLDIIFKDWADYSKTADVSMGKFADKAKLNLTKVNGEWLKFTSQMETTQEKLAEINGKLEDENLTTPARNHLERQKAKYSAIQAKSTQTMGRLLREAYIEQTRLELKQKRGVQLTKEEVAAYQKLARAQLALPRFKGTIEESTYNAEISLANSVIERQKRRAAAIRKSTIAATQARTELNAGIDVMKNRATILSSLEEKERLNIKITKEEALAYQRLSREQMALPTFKGTLAESKYNAELSISKSQIEAEKRRQIALRNSAIEENRLNAEIKIGMNVTENKLSLLRLLERREKIRGSLTDQNRRKLEALRQEQEKLLQQQNTGKTDGGFLSASWLKRRLVWFVQLRLAWSAYRGIQASVRNLMEAEIELARAMRTANSEMLTRTEIAKRYMRAMGEATATLGASWKQSGEALYQLGSAGLSAEEAIAGLKPALQLIVGLEGDATSTTKTLASIYNNFGDTLDDVGTKQKKLQYIADLLAAVWKKKQIEIGELSSAYSRVAATAKEAGISLQELTVILGVLHQHAIKGSKAGTQFNNMLNKMIKNKNLLKSLFNVDIDPNSPLNILNVLKQLNNQLKTGKTTVYELAGLFQIFGLRSNTAAITVVKNLDEIIAGIERTKDVTGELADVVDEKLNNLSSQLDLLGKHFAKNFATNTAGLRKLLTEFIKALNKGWDTQDTSVDTRQTVLRLFRIRSREELKKEVERLGSDALKTLEEALWKELGNPKKFDRFGITSAFKKETKALIAFLKETRLDVFGEIPSSINLKGKPTKPTLPETEITAAEIEYNAKYKKQTFEERKKSLQVEIDYYKKQKIAAEADITENIARRSQSGRKLAADNRNKFAAKEKAAENELVKIQKDQLSIDNKIIDAKTKLASLRNKELNLGGLTNSEYKEELTHIQEIKDNAYKKADNLIAAAELENKNVKAVKLEAQAQKKVADQTARTATEQAKLTRYKQQKKELIALLQPQIDAEQEKLTLMELQQKPEEEILAQKKKVSDLTLNRLEQEKELATIYEELTLPTDKKITKEKQKQLQLEQQMFYLAHPVYAVWYNVNEQVKDLNKFLRETGTQAVDTFASSFADMAISVSEGSAKMGASLKSFFLNLIEDINRAIIRFLVMKAVAGIGGALGIPGTAPTSSSAGLLIGGGTSGIAPTINFGIPGFSKATGGVLPQIEAFQKFSSGGVTANPTLALLGDNASKKEIVIPEENIKSNYVSGYTREQGNGEVTIVNLISQADIAQAMAAKTGKNVILNTIGKDINSQGRTSKLLKRNY